VPALLPFRAFSYSEQAGPLEDLIYIPGEEAVRPLRPQMLVQDAEPELFIYRQRFRFPGETEESVRDGVMGILNRAEAGPVFLHEGTLPDRLAACTEAVRAGRSDPGSLWLWTHDDGERLSKLLCTFEPATFQVRDRFGCLHQFWRKSEPIWIAKIQKTLENKDLFLADGHHRYAAGWNLATIQIRSESLRSLPSHRLILENGFVLRGAVPINDLAAYRADTPPGRARLGLICTGGKLLGIEVPWEMRHHLLDGVRVEPVREVQSAVEAIESGRAEMALLVEGLSLDEIEAHARSGIFLPPKSTDFYPKLAAGIVMYRHQNESVNPPVPHLPGVR
jgi:uncharacterized protein (DUF1015 family)